MRSLFCILSAIAAVFAASVSCIADTAFYKVETADEARVTFHIKTPAPASGTRTSFGVDNDIVNVWVLVFKEAADGAYNYQYKARGEVLTQGSASTATFTAVLRQSDDPVKLMVTANCPDTFADDVTAGMSEDDARLAMTFSFLALTGIDAIPMAGDVVLPSLGAGQNSASVSLLRAMARVQVTVDPAVTNFEMTEMAVYRANTEMQIAATSGNIDTSGASPKVTAASVPSSPTPIFPLHKPGNPTDYIYTTESMPTSGMAELKNTATCIVVGGYYNGDTSKTLYYRIDFDSGLAGHPLGQILRNHTYRFTIKGVSVAGNADADTAATELATALNVNVVAWDDSATDVYIPATNDYFMTSNRSLGLAYEDNSTGTVTLTSTMPFSLTLNAMAAGGGPATISSDSVDQTGASGVSIMGTYFNFTLTRISRDDTATPPLSKYTLSVMALNDNTGGTNAQTVTVTVGGSTFTIDITQEPVPTYVAPRTMTVLSMVGSAGDYGSLGVYPPATGNTGEDSENLRRMLLQPLYFGSADDSVVKLDELILMEQGSTYYDSASDVTALTATLKNVDVIIMCGWGNDYNLPEATCCNVILNWLKNPAHIMIMYQDDDDANTMMRNALNGYLPYSYDSMGWTYFSSNNSNSNILKSRTINGVVGANITGINTGYVFGTAPDVRKAGDEIFLGDNAPFGAVNTGAGFRDGDTIGTYFIGDIPDYVIPVINMAISGTYNGITGYYETSAVQAAVDTRYGIVWMGESQTGGYPSFSTVNSDSPYASDLNRILGNMWAWIVNRVNP